MDTYNIVAGLFVGILIGTTGMGGGSLMTPILIWLFGVAPTTAIGTNLCFSALTKLIGSGVYIRNNSVDWLVLRRLSIGSIPAAMTTLWLIHMMGVSCIPDKILMSMLGVVLLLTAVVVLFKPSIYSFFRTVNPYKYIHLKKHQSKATIIMGAILGVTVSLTSIGAGTLTSVVLVYLYPSRMNATRLVGTDIVHAIPLTIVSGFGYLLMGEINFSVLASSLVGSIPGIILGSYVGTNIPEKWLRVAITSVMIIIGCKMI